MQQAGELARLDIPARPLRAQRASNIRGLHELQRLGLTVEWRRQGALDLLRMRLEPAGHVLSRLVGDFIRASKIRGYLEREILQ